MYRGVLVGGPGTGETTVLDHLSLEGYAVGVDAATTIDHSRTQGHGIGSAARSANVWRTNFGTGDTRAIDLSPVRSLSLNVALSMLRGSYMAQARWMTRKLLA